MSRSSRLLLAAGLLLFGGACKPSNDQAALKDLSSFAAGEIVSRNQCSAAPNARAGTRRMAARVAFEGQLPEARKTALKAEVATALSAIPGELDVLAADLGLTIILSDQTSSMCKKAGAGKIKGDEAFDSCFLFSAKTAKRAQVLALYVRSDESAVRGSLVRGMGYVLSQFISDLVDSNGIDLDLNVSGSPVNRRLKEVVAASFVVDVMGSLIPDQVRNLNTYLGPDAYRILNGNLKAFEKTRTIAALYKDLTFNATSAADAEANRRQFEDFVYAESFDSFYCNNWGPYDRTKAVSALIERKKMTTEQVSAALINTRRTMQEFFPRTYGVFEIMQKPYNESLAKLSSQLRAAKAKSKKGVGLSLGDNWGLPSWVSDNPLRTAMKNNFPQAEAAFANNVGLPAVRAADEVASVTQFVVQNPAEAKAVAGKALDDDAQRRADLAVKAFEATKSSGSPIGAINGTVALVTGTDVAADVDKTAKIIETTQKDAEKLGAGPLSEPIGIVNGLVYSRTGVDPTDKIAKAADRVGELSVNPGDAKSGDIKTVLGGATDLVSGATGVIPIPAGKVKDVVGGVQSTLGTLNKTVDIGEAGAAAIQGDPQKAIDLAKSAALDQAKKYVPGSETAGKILDKVVTPEPPSPPGPSQAPSEAPSDDAPANDPPADDSSASEPPPSEPPASEPPAFEPPASEPPAFEPPASEPPASEPPAE